MKVLVFDLDGTLLSSDEYVSFNTKDYLMQKRRIIIKLWNTGYEMLFEGDLKDQNNISQEKIEIKQ